MASDEVIDVFAAAGLQNPDISILSDEFLAEVRDMPQRNLAVELLEKLLKDEIKLRQRRSIVQSRKFSEVLQASVRRYHDRRRGRHRVGRHQPRARHAQGGARRGAGR